MSYARRREPVTGASPPNAARIARPLLARGIVLVLALASAGGCNILGGVGYIVHGPPKAPAVYELQDRPTVIFVDDRNSTIPARSEIIRRRIAEVASRELMNRGLVTVTIQPQDALAAARLHDRYEQVMSIDKIGATVGAEQVIYVEMLAFKATTDGYTPKPYAACMVKVWDADANERLFPGPEVPEGAHPLQVSGLPVNPELYRSRGTLVQVYETLADQVGIELTKLFYEHEIRELGSQSDPARH